MGDREDVTSKIAIPPHGKLKVIPVANGIYFPHTVNEVMLSQKSTAELIANERFFIIIHSFKDQLRIPKIGTLAFVQEVETHRGKGDLLKLLLLERVAIDRVSALALPDGKIFEATWREIRVAEPTEAIWVSQKFQSNILLIRSAFTDLCYRIVGVTEDIIASREKEEPEELLEALEKVTKALDEGQMALAMLASVKRHTIAVALDKVSSSILGFFINILGIYPSKEFLTGLREILFTVEVEEQIKKLYRFVPWCLAYLEEEIEKKELDEVEDEMGKTKEESRSASEDLRKRWEEIKDSLPQSVNDQIARWIPHASPKSETGRVHGQYIEWLLDLPWTKTTEDQKDFSAVRKILEEDHYGLEEIKERILEFLAIRRIKQDAKAPILCLVGPPGVGKTSLGKSIARAMNRKFIRRSLGGLKDEAELRGHRRTYIGALPGTIVQGLKEAGSKNPVFMLDEVDKLGQHGKDIPEHALLEILDPEQNHLFRDNYIEIPFDLSQVLFITTANIKDTIHDAVQNRMEIIELPGYTEDEKIAIAERHIIPKVHHDYGLAAENNDRLKALGLTSFSIKFSKPALQILVSKYVYDAGMRETEQLIKRIVQKIILEVSEGKSIRSNHKVETDGEENGLSEEEGIIRVTTRNIAYYLGEPQVKEWMPDLSNLPPGVGVVLMVTSNGNGMIGFVETSSRPDNRFDRKNTGYLSEVLKESVEVAASRLLHTGGILAGVSHKMFVHTHFPSGAIHKDGPSAGVQTLITWYSMILDVPIEPYFAATGEITLKRNVILPVGGIRQKLLAAERAGIKKVVIPLANRKDLDKLPKPVREEMRIVVSGEIEKSLGELVREANNQFTVYCLNTIEEVLTIAFPNHFPPPSGFFKEKSACES